MAKSTDDLEAVRAVVDAVDGFNATDQQRIFRWAAEKLGLPQPFGAGVSTPPPGATHATHTPTQIPGATSSPLSAAGGNIKSFVGEKAPRSAVQLAATVAYWFRFEAPPSERKEAINKDDLQEACRKAGRERFVDPYKALANAHTLGLLDKGAEPGTFAINSVGENLVAMTLPAIETTTGNAIRKRKKSAAKSPAKKTANKAHSNKTHKT